MDKRNILFPVSSFVAVLKKTFLHKAQVINGENGLKSNKYYKHSLIIYKIG